MPLDANGIWQYEETETAAPFSAMLNRLAGSVSDAVGPHITDTGPVNVSLAAGITSLSGYTLIVRRIGPVVYMRGRITGLTVDTNNAVTSTPLAAQFRPGVPIQDLPMPTNSSTGVLTAVRAWVTSSGDLSMRPDDGDTVYVNTSWLAG